MAGPVVVHVVVHGQRDMGRTWADHRPATTPRGGVDMRVPHLPPAPHIFKSLFTIKPVQSE